MSFILIPIYILMLTLPVLLLMMAAEIVIELLDYISNKNKEPDYGPHKLVLIKSRFQKNGKI